MNRSRAHPAEPQKLVFLFSMRIAGCPCGVIRNLDHLKLAWKVSPHPFLKLSSNWSQYSASSPASALRTPGGSGFVSVLPNERVTTGDAFALASSAAFSCPRIAIASRIWLRLCSAISGCLNGEKEPGDRNTPARRAASSVLRVGHSSEKSDPRHFPFRLPLDRSTR